LGKNLIQLQVLEPALLAALDLDQVMETPGDLKNASTPVSAPGVGLAFETLRVKGRQISAIVHTGYRATFFLLVFLWFRLAIVSTTSFAVSTVFLLDANAPMEVGRRHNGSGGLLGQNKLILSTCYQLPNACQLHCNPQGRSYLAVTRCCQMMLRSAFTCHGGVVTSEHIRM
jgi:hypothetical protein